MGLVWKRIRRMLLGDSAPSDDRSGLPSTYMHLESNAVVQRPKLFEPALQHFGCGYRQGEPTFADADVAWKWRKARRKALDRLVELVADSPWADRLLLRGSLLLAAWFGDSARDPGDVDWVVTPQSTKADDPWSQRMFEDVVQRVALASPVEGAAFDPDRIAVDVIWCYDRFPGRRLAAVWESPGLPPGQVHMDFVFQEPMPTPPVVASIPRDGGPPLEVWAADASLSLAWKLMWIYSDRYARAKDLYDACLLAERATLSRELLKTVVEGSADPPSPDQDLLDALRTLHLEDWDDFRREYPSIRGDAEGWRDFLVRSLEPSLGAPES